MRYLVSARKYRPQRFGELVGQEHVAETLRNALRLDRLAHAYLFSGPRGVGKTTAARILAKAINCEVAMEDRPDAEPCRACASCRAFEEGRSLNIIEIDAASNNKVDDIRELRETVRVPPQGARRKVYIVDEVHMLSTSAFNALLKTLEEPPPYVLFIFATTEPHKVLPTILSRCQRFDFRRIGVAETMGHLHAICAEEGVDADEASLMLIARKGDGALRDALSAFDQAVALEGTTLRYGSLAAALGVVDIDLYFEATEHVHARSAAGMLGLVDGLVRRGYDLAEFIGGMQEHLRNLLVARTMPDARLIEASQAIQARYADEAARWTEADLLRQLALLADAEPAMRGSSQPRLRLELALLKLTALATAHDLNAALRALERLDAHARTGGALPAPAAAPAPRTDARPAPAAPRPSHVVEAAAPYAAPEPTRRPLAAPAPVTSDGPAATRPSTLTPPDDRADDAPPPAPAPGPRPVAPAPPAAPPGLPTRPAPEPRTAPDDLAGALFGKPALSRKGPSAVGASPLSGHAPGPVAGDGAPAPTPAMAVPGQPTPNGHMSGRSDAPQVEVRPSLDPGLVGAWQALADRAGSARMAACLRQARPLHLDGRTLVLSVPDTLTADTIRAAAGALLADLADLLSGGTALTGLACTVVEAAAAPGTAHPDDPFALLQQVKQSSPAAQRLIDRFGAELVY